MLCRACGMQNQNPNATVCEWCKKPLNGAPGMGGHNMGGANTQRPTPNAQPLNAQPLNIPITPNAPIAPTPTARIQRTTLTGEVIEVDVTPSHSANAPGMPPQINPNTSVNTPNGVYTGAPYAAMQSAGANYNAMAPQMLRDRAGMPEVSQTERWECFLAIASPILLLSALLVHNSPGTIWWVAFLSLFVLSLALGGSGAVPTYSEAYFDVAVMLVVTFLFGPIIGLVVYLLTAAVKQECNTAVVGLLILQILIFMGLPYAFITSGTAMKQMGGFMLFGIMNGFAVFVAFLGWLLSSFLRPVGE